MSTWKESDHPRDSDGKFIDKGVGDSLEELRQEEIATQKVVAEYKKSTNPKLAQYVKDVADGKTSESFELVGISDRERADILQKTGIDVTDYTRIMPADSIKHIKARHGKYGKADQSMADVDDIARIEFVITNYDKIALSKDSTRAARNADGTQSKVLVYEKRINGKYFVAEAVPNSKRKMLVVISAYKNNAK